MPSRYSGSACKAFGTSAVAGSTRGQHAYAWTAKAWHNPNSSATPPRPHSVGFQPTPVCHRLQPVGPVKGSDQCFFSRLKPALVWAPALVSARLFQLSRSLLKQAGAVPLFLCFQPPTEAGGKQEPAEAGLEPGRIPPDFWGAPLAKPSDVPSEVL